MAEQRLPLTQNSAAFIFASKARTHLKILLWDNNGVWLCTRRQQRGHFTWPRDGEKAWHLIPAQFAWLTVGVDWQRLTAIPQKKNRYAANCRRTCHAKNRPES